MKNLDFPPAFVTFGWCRSAYAVVWSLGQQGINLHVGDASPLAMSRFSRYCKSFTKLPDFFIQPERYFQQICKALKKTGAKVLLPCHEDVGLFSRRRDELPSDVLMALPKEQTYSLAEDKFDCIEFASKHGCPTPFTVKVNSLSELQDLAESVDLPVVIKTRAGNSAKGVCIVHSRGELCEKFRGLIQTFQLRRDRWPIIQEFLPGDAAGVCVLYDHGRCIANFAERYLRCKEPGKFGTSTLRETFENQELISHALAVMDKLEWHGVAHLDFVADKEGDFKLIEINPRLWGALALSVFSGINFPYLWYLNAIGSCEPDLPELQTRKIKCRWVVGDCVAFLGLIKQAKILDSLKLIMPEKKCYHDDFIIFDPLPFLFEVFDYFIKFAKAAGSTKPVRGNMIR